MSIQADLKNAVVWIASILPPTADVQYLFIFSLSLNFILRVVSWNIKILGIASSFLSCLFALGLVWVVLSDPFVSQSPREFYAFHFLGQILVCVYTIKSSRQISISCTIPNGTPSPTQILLCEFSVFIYYVTVSFLSPNSQLLLILCTLSFVGLMKQYFSLLLKEPQFVILIIFGLKIDWFKWSPTLHFRWIVVFWWWISENEWSCSKRILFVIALAWYMYLLTPPQGQDVTQG